MADFQARSGPASILASGMVIAYQKNPIEITFGSPPFTLIFNFVDERQTSPVAPLASRVSARVRDPIRVELTFYNFSNPLGTGNGPPLPIGVLNDLPIFLSYRIYPLAGGDKTIQFTLYALQPPEAPKVETAE
jgi:hypothetical protein